MEAVETMSLGRRLFAQDEHSESPHLRDFLRIKEDETYNYGRTNFSGQTLDSILRLERGTGPVQVQSSRTLLDIIRDDPINRNENRKSWRHFRHRLRIRLQGSGSGSALLDTPSSRRVISHRDSNRFNTSITAGSDPPQAEPDSSEIISNVREEAAMTIGGETGEQPVRTSLMALLAENDRHMGFDGSVFVTKVEEKGEEEVEEKDGSGGTEYSCCVCMVRHKGAAFIPCGHTFCRLCCREIWIQRGNCPLCNSLILEILDIF